MYNPVIWGGKKESTIIAFGGKAPAPMAAMANGAMATARDYESTHKGGPHHPGVSVIPAALAIAERQGAVNGKEFITAVALGLDVQGRMGLATGPDVHEDRGWHMSGTLGPFGAAAASGRLLGLGEKEMVNAFGLALSHASGTIQFTADGALSKQLQVGSASRGGVVAALLAQKGFTGTINSLEGRWGFFEAYLKGWPYDLSKLTDELGKRFEGINLIFKPWPSCAKSHPHIDAVLQVVKKYDIHPEDVEQVRVFMSLPADRHMLTSPSIETKRKPRNMAEAQFSLPFLVAVALDKRRVCLKDLSDEGIRDLKVLDIAQKVQFQTDPKLAKMEDVGIEPSRVEIRLKNGKALMSELVDYSYGNPQNPMSREDFIEKFKDCAAYSLRPLPKKNTRELVDLVDHLEEVRDVTEITKLLA